MGSFSFTLLRTLGVVLLFLGKADATIDDKLVEQLVTMFPL
jgi:hypothetical protein